MWRLHFGKKKLRKKKNQLNANIFPVKSSSKINFFSYSYLVVHVQLLSCWNSCRNDYLKLPLKLLAYEEVIHNLLLYKSIANLGFKHWMR